MVGAKTLREKGRRALEAIHRREQNPSARVDPDPDRKHTAPGMMFGFQERLILATERAERAEADLAALRNAGSDLSATTVADARARAAELSSANVKRPLQQGANLLRVLPGLNEQIIAADARAENAEAELAELLSAGKDKDSASG